MLKYVFAAVLVVGMLASGCARTVDAWSCGPLVGTWLMDTTRTSSTVARPVTFTVHAGGTVSDASGSEIAALGFNGRSSFQGDCSRIGPNLYRIMLEELLYRDGLIAGRFLIELTLQHDPATDTITGVPGESRFKITAFTATPPAAAPAPCVNSADDLVKDSMVREADNEYTCRSADDIELTARRIGTDSFFAAQ